MYNQWTIIVPTADLIAYRLKVLLYGPNYPGRLFYGVIDL